MKTKKPFSPQHRIKSFGYALNGWKILVNNEPNALIHVASAIVAIVLGCCFRINPTEWIAVVCCIVMVIGAELFNSAIEIFCDHVQPEKHEAIKKIKDLSAGAVLIIAVGALITGFIIFLPKIISIQWNF